MSKKLELTWVGKDKKISVEPRILIENKKLSNIENDENTENMLIHGDNLLALKALEQKYAGKIKCIYIDPPYNTGAAFEHYDDNLEHSIWLGLMRERLVILRNLLSEDGVIFVSIDDNEVSYLQILMNEIFGRNNFLVNIPTIMNLKGNQDQFGFAGTHEYTLVFSKDKSKVKLNRFKIDDEEILKHWLEDDIGLYKRGATLKSTGEESGREDRPKMFYPILIKNNKVFCIEDEEFNLLYNSKEKKFDDEVLENLKLKYTKNKFKFILPYKNEKEYGRWRWGFDTFKMNYENEIIIVQPKKNKYSLYKKQRPQIGEIPTSKPKSFFYKPEYSSGNGTAQIKKIFGYTTFLYPKPEELIKDFLLIGSNENDLVLDSFLGSGTTAAVAHKMNRRYIGIEMGEHAYTHCKVRLDKVISGEDKGGITKNVNWQGGGAYRFYELAPTLINEDKFGEMVINKEYSPEMLVNAVALHEGYNFNPNKETFWKQSKSTENSYLFVTTKYVDINFLNSIKKEMKDGEYLVIACKNYDQVLEKKYSNIEIKKIPEMLLEKCEFNVENYNLNIINTPIYEEELGSEIDE